MRIFSLASLFVMIAAILGLFATHSLFSAAPLVIAVQFVAFALMVWARITFGRRSFSATADPTEGGLVTTGPYHFIRHPIYTAVSLFVFAGAVAHFSFVSLGLALVVFAGAFGRMLTEEHLLLKCYPEYADYAAKTQRMLPYYF